MLQIVHADFDEEDDTFLLTVSIARAGSMPKKPKPKTPPPKVTPPPKETPPPPKPAPTPPKPKPAAKLKTIATAAAKLQPPKPKVETKQEKLKKRDPFFETEEYEVSRSVYVVFTDVISNLLLFFEKLN